MRNFGQPKPEGYRKALRVMQLAAKFGRPVLTFIDTPGAYPGIDAEERGQGEAIARNLREMARFPFPSSSPSPAKAAPAERWPSPSAIASNFRKRFLLRDFSRRLRLDHLARFHQSGNRRHRHENHGHRPERTRHHGRNHSRTRWRRPQRPRSRRETLGDVLERQLLVLTSHPRANSSTPATKNSATCASSSTSAP